MMKVSPNPEDVLQHSNRRLSFESISVSESATSTTSPSIGRQKSIHFKTLPMTIDFHQCDLPEHVDQSAKPEKNPFQDTAYDY